MKKDNKKAQIATIFIISLILIFTIFKIINKKYVNEDVIFFKILNLNNYNKKSEGSIKQSSKKECQKYIFDMSEEQRNVEFKSINLKETVNNKTLINEKIAPGTKGDFEIIINSNSDCLYQIKFKSLNQKPQNLTFQLEGSENEYYQLEQLEKELKGKMKRRKEDDTY